jgi:glucose-6-phosphate dehydrogenase assembly protein OpcA
LSAASSKQVCCEQVTLESGGERINEVPSAVTPLLVSDLPVCLWWRAEPRLGDRLFKRLAGTSDRVIIDSADFNSPYEDLRTLAALLRERPLRTAYSDLNWARLTAWRALLAGFYDVPRYRTLLEQIDEVVIEYAPPSAGAERISPRALVLAGWLASRLGWKPKEGRDRSPSVVRFEAKENDVVVEFRRTESEAIEAGRIALVSLSTAADSTATFNVKRSADRLRIETDINIGEQNKIQRVLSYENHTEAQLIARGIEIQGRDRVFEEAALAAAEMIGQLH